MKNIEINNKQKENLLEMCKKLFPEYPDLQFGVKEKHNWSKEYLVFGLTGNEPIIHWFEFCMTHLANKMIELGELPNFNNKLDYDFFSILQSSWWESHPVDYLYKEFKKLK